MRNLLIGLFILVTSFSFAQSKGTVSGIVQDKELDLEPVSFASVYVQGKPTLGTSTDFDGAYTLQLAPGSYTIVFEFVGYKTVKKAITIKGGVKQTVNVVMESQAAALGTVLITVATTKETEEALVEAQKEAVVIQTAIGAKELSKKGIGDVAAAVTKAAGVTKEESGSGSIFVRGLGDRYNVTTLNGLPLPSNNPANKNISLDIFSTDIVEYVGISKTFESQNYGDFGGANIDINSKKFSGDPYVSVGLSTGVNENVLGLDNFYLQDGPSSSGFKTIDIPSNPFNPDAYQTSWDRQSKNKLLNSGFSIAAGKRFKIKNAGKISAFITASFDSDVKYIETVDRGGVLSDGFISSDYFKKSYKYSTNSTVMGTLNYKINNQNSILFTSLFLNSTSQDYSEYEGSNIDFDGGVSGTDLSGIVKRGTFDKTQLLVNQFVGKHEISEKLNLKWGLGHSLLSNVIPDRMQNTFVPERKENSDLYTFFTDSSIHNHRYFQELDENEISTNIALSYKFNQDEESDDYKSQLTLGYTARFKKIEFESNQYSFNPKFNKFNFPLSDIHNVDAYFNSSQFVAGQDGITNIPQTYDGDLMVNSLFLNYKHSFSPNFTAIFGARLESVSQDVNFATSLVPDGDVSTFSAFKVLPSLISKYKLNEKQNLKFAFSQTYTLPQFKEKVLLLFEEVAQGYQGNPDLYESTNYNVDLGWEYYPESGELVSVTAFGKLIQNPINEVFINSASGDISWVNSGEEAKILGVEFELRKNIFVTNNKETLQTKLSGGINASYMYHRQDLDEAKVSEENKNVSASFTFDDSRLAGASDVLANADITIYKEFSEDKNLTATLTYGYFSDKLAVIGSQNRGNIIDKSVDRLDLIVKSSLTDKINVGLSFKNILNPVYERVQAQSEVPGSSIEDIVINSYKKGAAVSASISYKF
ncbi:TonB-dependent receptor domain-containing protein [Wenyingzhuangia sp. IMCC45574]